MRRDVGHAGCRCGEYTGAGFAKNLYQGTAVEFTHNVGTLSLAFQPAWQDDGEDHFRNVANYRMGAYAKRAAPAIAPDAPLTLAFYLFANSDYNVIPVASD